ncbi:MAG: hypothetical protein AAFQ07_18395 [Chloroflexota bacterium]
MLSSLSYTQELRKVKIRQNCSEFAGYSVGKLQEKGAVIVKQMNAIGKALGCARIISNVVADNSQTSSGVSVLLPDNTVTVYPFVWVT